MGQASISLYLKGQIVSISGFEIFFLFIAVTHSWAQLTHLSAETGKCSELQSLL